MRLGPRCLCSHLQCYICSEDMERLKFGGSEPAAVLVLDCSTEGSYNEGWNEFDAHMLKNREIACPAPVTFARTLLVYIICQA
ncbi:hypothetical protein BS78_05G150700 [Paspalum vaginatum]|nr:hypothetical protein BS78_05G150700 [Paspalum vaginatum]